MASADSTARRGPGRVLARPELAAAAGVVLVWCIFAVVAGESFRGLAGTAAVLNAAAPLGILAVAVACS